MNQHKHNLELIFLCIILLIIAISAGFYSNSVNTSTEETIEISVILPDIDNTRWKTFKTGMHAAAKECNINLKMIKSDDVNEDINDVINDGTKGIVTEFTNEEEGKDIIKTTTKKVPMILTSKISSQEKNNSALGIIELNNDAIANTLALQLTKNYSSKQLTIGVLMEDSGTVNTEEILNGLKSKLSEMDFSITWSLTSKDLSVETLKKTQKEYPVDAIVALDSNSLELAADYKNSSNDSITLYGIGASDKCIYNTDLEVIKGIIMPDDYYAGYTAITSLYKKIKNNEALDIYPINYRVITKANLFNSSNEKLLFPIGN